MNSRGWSETEPPGCSRTNLNPGGVAPSSGGGVPDIPAIGLPLRGSDDLDRIPGVRSFLANPRLFMGEPLHGEGTGPAVMNGRAAKIAKLKGIGVEAVPPRSNSRACRSGKTNVTEEFPRAFEAKSLDTIELFGGALLQLPQINTV